MITDEMLATAAKELSLVMSATFPDPSKEVHHFSLRFKRKMKQLIKKTNHPTRYLWAQRVASFVLALFMGFMVLFATSPSVRASVIGWIKEQYESYIEYFFPSGLTTKEKERFEITQIPEGFEEILFVDEENFCLSVYSDGDGNKIDFVYSRDPDAGNMMVKSEGSTVIHTYVGGCQADLYLPDDSENATSLIWYDAEKNMMFYISTVSTTEGIIRMAESVK